MADHWPRALLRASLRERGHDAVGAPDLDEARVYPPTEPDRGPVRLIVLEAVLVTAETRVQLEGLLLRHDEPRVLLVAEEAADAPAGPWAAVVQKPLQIPELVSAVERLIVSEMAD